MAEVTLVTNNICPFAQRAWLTLLQKKVPFTYRWVSLQTKEAYHTEIYHKALGHDPKSDGKVPVLIHGDIVLAQSDLISYYIAETFNTGTELIPQDTFVRAKMRHFANNVPSKLFIAFYKASGYNYMQEKQKQEIRQGITEAFQTVQANLQGPYVLGQQFSLADILLYPWFERWIAIKHYLGIQIDVKYTKIHTFIATMQGRDSVKQTRAETSDEFIVKGYRSYFE